MDWTPIIVGMFALANTIAAGLLARSLNTIHKAVNSTAEAAVKEIKRLNEERLSEEHANGDVSNRALMDELREIKDVLRRR